MPLDPQARQFLDQLASLGAPALWELPPEEARAASAAAPPRGTYPEVRPATVDATVPGPSGDIPVRVYRPAATPEPAASAEPQGPLPVVVYFHGGGWVLGSIEGHDRICSQLAVRVPAVVVSVGYRLAPENPYPAAVEDAWAVTNWVAEHAGDLGADGGRLAVAGDSAGANLAAVICRRARDGGGPPIRFQLLVYPVTDLTMAHPSHLDNSEGYLLTAESMKWFIAHYLQGADPTAADASPLHVEDLSTLPPALIITAEFDPLRDEGEAYGARLSASGGYARVSRYDGMIHGFFTMDSILDASSRAQDEAATALHEVLTGGPA